MDDPPYVHVVILNYNGVENEHLDYCIPSIKDTDYENLDIVIVDNNSSDNSLEYIRERHPDVELIETGENLGWAGGNNVGIRNAISAGADYVVLANNDIRVHPQWISAGVRAAESDPEVGFVGFDVYGRVRSVPLENYKEACEQWNGIDYEYTDEFIDGMALFVRTDVFSKVGLIDEDFWAYGEENDLEIRGKKAGYKRIRTNVPVWHYSSGSFEQVPMKASYFAIRNQIRLAIKHEGPAGVVRRILSLYNTGCNPLLDIEDNKIFARRRPSNILINFFFITYCLLWNLVFLPRTLQRRRKDYGVLDGRLSLDGDLTTPSDHD